MKKIHFFSGITISVFVALHIFNHFYGLLGAQAHIELMNDLRVLYRNIIAETILLTAVGVQVFSGIRLFLRKRKTVSDSFEKVQIWSGLYLAVFFVIHLSAVFSGRLIFNLDTNFYFGVAGLNTFPLTLFFAPYYGLAIISFFGHVSAVHAKKMRTNVLGVKPKEQSYILLCIGIVSAVIILYGLTNGFEGVEIPKAYDTIIGK